MANQSDKLQLGPGRATVPLVLRRSPAGFAPEILFPENAAKNDLKY